MGFEWDYENIVCLMCVLSNFVPICYRLAFFSKLASDSIVFFFKNFFLMYFTQHKLRQFFLRSCFFDVFFPIFSAGVCGFFAFIQFCLKVSRLVFCGIYLRR